MLLNMHFIVPGGKLERPRAQLHSQKRTRTAHCSHTAAASRDTASLAIHSQTAASTSLPFPSSSRGRPPLSFDDNCSCKNAQGSTAWWSGTTASSHESLIEMPQAILWGTRCASAANKGGHYNTRQDLCEGAHIGISSTYNPTATWGVAYLGKGRNSHDTFIVGCGSQLEAIRAN